MTEPSSLWVYTMIVVAGAGTTYVWRFAGVIAAARVGADSEILRWVRAVATALIAGLVAKLVLNPPGALADVDVMVRILAFVAGFAIFAATGRKVLLGVIGGMVLIIVLTLVFGQAG